MSLRRTIEEDLKDALRKSDKTAISVLRLVISAIKNAEIAQKSVLIEDDLLPLLQKEVKKREDSIAAYRQGGRGELAAKEAEEILILKKYLSQEMSDEEIEEIVKETMAALNTTASDFGRVMGEVMPKIKGRASGDRVKDIVKKELDA